MSHDAGTVQMGGSLSSVKEVSNKNGSIAAGKAVHLKSDDTITTAEADGSLLGISMGRDMSGIGRTSIARKGLRVPILLGDATPVIGAQVQISTTTGLAVASGTAVNAYYVSEELAAVDEDGAAITDGCALIDFPGGL
jgi:subtilisin family serine protease